MLSELKHLLLIEDELGGVQHYVLSAPLYSIGRDPKCDIFLASRFVSRRQATLVRITDDDGTFYYRIVDGIPKGRSSSNGILVNGKKIMACDLQDEDEITFGPQVRAVYRLSEDTGKHDEPLFEDTLIPTNCWSVVTR